MTIVDDNQFRMVLAVFFNKVDFDHHGISRSSTP